MLWVRTLFSWGQTYKCTWVCVHTTYCMCKCTTEADVETERGRGKEHMSLNLICICRFSKLIDNLSGISSFFFTLLPLWLSDFIRMTYPTASQSITAAAATHQFCHYCMHRHISISKRDIHFGHQCVHCIIFWMQSRRIEKFIEITYYNVYAETSPGTFNERAKIL